MYDRRMCFQKAKSPFSMPSKRCWRNRSVQWFSPFLVRFIRLVWRTWPFSVVLMYVCNFVFRIVENSSHTNGVPGMRGLGFFATTPGEESKTPPSFSLIFLGEKMIFLLQIDVACYVTLVALAESIVVNFTDALAMVESAKGDLRASLNLAQFLNVRRGVKVGRWGGKTRWHHSSFGYDDRWDPAQRPMGSSTGSGGADEFCGGKKSASAIPPTISPRWTPDAVRAARRSRCPRRILVLRRAGGVVSGRTARTQWPTRNGKNHTEF